MMARIGRAVKAWAAQELISGYLEEYFANATVEEVLKLARSGRGWDAVSPDNKLRMVRMARQNRAALAMITLDDVYRWLVESNPELARQMFANPEITAWLGSLWREFEAMRASVVDVHPPTLEGT